MQKFILFIVLVAFLDMFSQLPIMSPFAKDLGATPALIGLVVGMYSFSNMFGNILAGFWVDRYDGRKVLILGLSSTAIALLLYLGVSTPEQLIVVRFIHGIVNGLIVPAAFTVIANKGEKKKQGKSMAVTGAAVGIAAIIGPAFGGIITARYRIDWVFITMASLMLVTAIFSHFLLPKGSVKKTVENKTSMYTVISILKTPVLVISFIGAFSLMFAQGVLAYLLPLLVDSLHYGTQYSGILLSTFGITAIVIFSLPTNKLFDHFKHHHLMMFGMSLIGFALIMLSIASSLLFLFICMVFYGLGFAFLFPSISAMVAKYTDPQSRGKAFGLFYAFFSLGVVVGSSLIGILAVSFATGFVIAACILFVNTIWMLFYFNQKKAK